MTSVDIQNVPFPLSMALPSLAVVLLTAKEPTHGIPVHTDHPDSS
jgi:hypothetical protein